MVRLTKPYNSVDGSEVPGYQSPRLYNRLEGPLGYVVSEGLTSPQTHFLSKAAKQRGDLRCQERTVKNSGLPENRKVRGNGGIIVPGRSDNHLPLGKGPRLPKMIKRLLSGTSEPSKLKIELARIREDAHPPGAKISGLSKIMSSPDFLIGC